MCTSSSIGKSAHLAARVEWRTVSNALEKSSAIEISEYEISEA